MAIEDPLAAREYLDLEARNGRPLFIPCVVVTDLNMPGMSGLELCEWIRGHPLLKDMRVIMLTDSELEADEQKAREVGVNHYERKYPSARAVAELLVDLPCVEVAE